MMGGADARSAFADRMDWILSVRNVVALSDTNVGPVSKSTDQKDITSDCF